MNVRAFALAVLVVAAPAVVTAQVEPSSLAASEPAAPPSRPVRVPEAAPLWTLGAGVAFGQYLVLGTSTTLPLAAATPLATASVERRIGERTWLVLAGDALVARRSDEDEAGTTSDSDETDVLTSVAVGLRRVVTRPGTVVDVSLFATLGGGYVRSHEEIGSGESVYDYDEEGTFLNLGGGIALERALTDALALRISTPLAYLGWSRLERDSALSNRDTEYVGLSVSIAPRLELRLAF